MPAIAYLLPYWHPTVSSFKNSNHNPRFDDFGFGANILQTNTEKIQEVDALEGLE